MFEQLFLLLQKIEEGVGNRVHVGIYKRADCLELRLFWPDGYRLTHLIDGADIRHIDEEVFVSYFIHKAKEAHPALAPFIS